MNSILRLANYALLVLYPMAWFAPLLKAGFILPIFGLTEISVVSGLQSLWESDAALALVVTTLAIFLPYMKTIAIALIHSRLLSPRLLPLLTWIGRLAMADVFLVALYIVITKASAPTHIETQWGLWLFTACVLASLFISALTPHRRRG
jgi:paraquat-inducible protein A